MIERIKQILEYYSESSSSFAETIDVPRSSISHLLSGRNKPSLDFVMKIIDKYPEVDLYWLLYGTGYFPKRLVTAESAKENSKTTVKNRTPNLFAETRRKEESPIKNSNMTISEIDKKLKKVVLLYEDGTFEVYKP